MTGERPEDSVEESSTDTPDERADPATEAGGAEGAVRVGMSAPDEHDDQHDDQHRRRRWAPWLPRMGEDEDSFARRIALQWAVLRDERRSPQQQPVIATGPSNFARAQVPYGVDLAASWSWRFLVIAAAALAIGWVVKFFALIVMPLLVALLITALVIPWVNGASRTGVPRRLASLVAVLGVLGLLGLLITVATEQVAQGFGDLVESVVQGLGDIRIWLREGPLNASDSQINAYLQQAQEGLQQYAAQGDVLGPVTTLGTALTNVIAGLFIVLLATYFFLAEGDRLWAWVVRIAPRAARRRFDSSGHVAWVSLTQFVRATVIVALVDAVFISIGAAVLQVPFVFAIGVLVFLGAFVPMIGATVAGAVAVLVALVDQGPLTALLMFAVIIAVQQIEGNVLQPFLMGRWVSVHPLGVILAITAGVLVAGVAGALVAVPFAAAVNAVVLHLADAADGVLDETPEGLEAPGMEES